MPISDEKIQNNNLKDNYNYPFQEPNFNIVKNIKKEYVVLLFVLIAFFIPFSESKKAFLWSDQRNQGKINPLASFVNIYAVQSENIKNNSDLEILSREENYFWSKIKNFPIVESPLITFNKESAIEETSSLKQTEAQDKPSEKEIPYVVENNTDTSAGNLAFSTISAPYNFLLIGDSFMGVYAAVGDLLEKSLLGYKDVKVNRFGKVSSGLSRPDFFDWNEKIKELIKLYNPNIIIIMMGTNDVQSLTVVNEKNQKKYLIFGSDKWQEEYDKRVQDFMKIITDKKITVFWVGLPIMREKNFSDNIKLINSIYEKEVNNFENSYFISTWELLCDKKGNYAAFLADKNGQNKATRVSDGIHLTFFAGKIATEQIIGQIQSKIILKSIK
jgi:hypothetical protein